MNCFVIKKFQLRYTIKKTNKNTLNPPSLTDSRAPPGSGSREKKGGAPPLLCSPLACAPWPRQQPGLAAAAVSAGRLRAAVRWSGPWPGRPAKRGKGARRAGATARGTCGATGGGSAGARAAARQSGPAVAGRRRRRRARG